MMFPLRILWNLQLNRIRKLSIMAIFGVGIVCIITSIVRVANLHSKAQSSQPAPSWLILWAVVEASIGKRCIGTNSQSMLTGCGCSRRGSMHANIRPAPTTRKNQHRLRLPKFDSSFQDWIP